MHARFGIRNAAARNKIKMEENIYSTAFENLGRRGDNRYSVKNTIVDRGGVKRIVWPVSTVWRMLAI